ncbi:Hypothetical protein GbCGDNIH3_8110 [Granulibacter bethesdensis]|uniref:Uncharacterized protein n=1 Tax=Granulibacter bethesdensis TaxID=364410 RepID=A0AAN1AP29_9PROT|nr:Hypothetical protein GbCGDNIH3_8110 [Granulibacter bethesdensis]
MIVAGSVPSGPHYTDIATRIPEATQGRGGLDLSSTMPIAMTVQPSVAIEGHMLGTAMNRKHFFC